MLDDSQAIGSRGKESVEFGTQLLAAAERYVGRGFVSHAELVGCGSRSKTFPGCMEIGLGPDSFDCSGLIIRALSDIIGRQTTKWAANIRHPLHMASLGTRVDLRSTDGQHDYPLGLVLVYHHITQLGVVPSAHVGIYAGGQQLLHARSLGAGSVALGPIRATGTSKRFSHAIDPFSLI